MDDCCVHLFIYGTLLDDDNEYAGFLRLNSTYIAAGYIFGKLYNLGQYPAAIYLPNETNKVYGNIVRLTDTKSVLQVLDSYEGCTANDASPTEYIRNIVTVTTAQGQLLDAWAYLLNLPTNLYPQISNGRWK